MVGLVLSPAGKVVAEPFGKQLPKGKLLLLREFLAQAGIVGRRLGGHATYERNELGA